MYIYVSIMYIYKLRKHMFRIVELQAQIYYMCCVCV